MGRRISEVAFCLLFWSSSIHALVPPSSRQRPAIVVPKVSTPMASAMLATSIMIATIHPAQAYVPTDYASETVQETVQALKDSSGNIEETFKVYESIAGIITEGKGVGGMVNYSESF